ncbi:MAG: hypothetical protein MRZ23_05920 [Finegoldia magna]|nr:hypothetical protein [Finegoldia magna]
MSSGKNSDKKSNKKSSLKLSDIINLITAIIGLIAMILGLIKELLELRIIITSPPLTYKNNTIKGDKKKVDKKEYKTSEARGKASAK